MQYTDYLQDEAYLMDIHTYLFIYYIRMSEDMTHID